jgi:Ca2+-binding RTX toxin-like protein
MAYNVTGTAGPDVLDQSGSAGPGTIVGLGGDDVLSTGSGFAQVFGNSGGDSVVLQTGNTGTVAGGTENDSFGSADNVGSMVLFGNEGADTVDTAASTNSQTIIGGDDSNDGPDSLFTGSAGDWVFGNGGNDTLDTLGGSDTVVSGFGNDSAATGGGNELWWGNQGNDTVDLDAGADTGWGGLANDSLLWTGAGSPVLFGNEGGDTLVTNGGTPTLVGGQDSADGNDSFGGAATVTAFVLGNGGNDSFNIGSTGGVTEVGGFGNDCMFFGNGAERSLLFGNEGNDVIEAFAGLTGATTVFGGQGNDSVITAEGRDTLQGNEGNDTIRGDAVGGISIDTISGGTGNDVFAYLGAGAGGQDGNNAGGGGPVEQITDLDWSVDRFDTQLNVTFAANMGAGTGANLNAASTNALAAAFALGGSGPAQVTAAQFTFSGRTYLVIEQTAAGTAAFDDLTDLLVDITGATGTIGNTNFI